MSGKTPSLAELYLLAAQLEQDRRLPLRVLRERDHALADTCEADDDVQRLRCWLAAVSASGGTSQERGARGPQVVDTEGSLAALGRVLALVAGFTGMAAFLLGSGRGLVNVFMFVLLFVVVQALLSLVALVVMARTAGGGAPLVLPLNPARWLLARSLPDRRQLRETQALLRLVLLRYGQELGALFTVAAVAGFFVVLFLSPFTFVWGSTYQLSDGFVQRMVGLLAAPWAAWLPQASVDAQVIAATRFHPAVSGLSQADLVAMGGWWPFLIMCMVCYALLPRLLLWLLSKYLYRREMLAAFLAVPGSELVLARMKTPLVRTQAPASATAVRAHEHVAADRGLLLLNWAGALQPGGRNRYPEFAAVPADGEVNAGLGSQREEFALLQARLVQRPVERLYVAVKSWEPPMAELADFLARFDAVPGCTLFLVPLGDKPVSAGKLEDWQAFARDLPFAAVAVHPLGRQ